MSPIPVPVISGALVIASQSFRMVAYDASPPSPQSLSPCHHPPGGFCSVCGQLWGHSALNSPPVTFACSSLNTHIHVSFKYIYI